MALKIEAYPNDFILLHWHYGKYDNEWQAEYYGHKWFLIIYILWWEIQILDAV